MNRPGFRGPGELAAPDLQTRLAETGAGGNSQARGLFPQNYWRTRKRRTRKVQVRQSTVDAVEYLVSRLMRALRFENPGINVRLPSHVNPPFRSIQWTFQSYEETPSIPALPTFTTITFNGNAAVPEGMRGVLSELQYWIESGDVDTILPTPYAVNLVVFKNSLPVPGYDNIRPGLFKMEGVDDIAGREYLGMSFPSPRAMVPITLEPGDVLQYAMVSSLGTPPDGYVRFQGWLYPVEIEADGIVGTLADRGGAIPIRS